MYGSLPNMDHQGYAARFAMTSVVYEDGRLPGARGRVDFRDGAHQPRAGDAPGRRRSTFRTVDTDAVVTTDDRSFRPVDMTVGPDGAIYVADWCDIRMDHTDPRDTWDKSCGRVWRLRAEDWRPVSRIDLAARSSGRLVSAGQPEKVVPGSCAAADRRASRPGGAAGAARLGGARGQLALEAVWTAYRSRAWTRSGRCR